MAIRYIRHLLAFMFSIFILYVTKTSLPFARALPKSNIIHYFVCLDQKQKQKSCLEPESENFVEVM